MQTECSADLFGFAPVEGRKVVAAFDGGTMTSEAGAMLLGATDRQMRLIERFAGCFTDHRAAELVVHEVAGLVGQRVFGIALGYEDLIDHDQLRHDPVMAVLGGKLAARRADCAPLAGKSTLNRLELSRAEPGMMSSFPLLLPVTSPTLLRSMSRLRASPARAARPSWSTTTRSCC